MFERIPELIENRKFSEIRAILEEMNPVDIAMGFEEIENDKEVVLFRLLPKGLAAETFTYLDSDMQESLIKRYFTVSLMWKLMI